MRRLFAAKLLFGYLLFLFSVTVCGLQHPGAPHNYVPFRTIGDDLYKGGFGFLINLIGNLAVFLPMGWIVPELLGRHRLAIRVVALSFALSLTIEVLQGISGRRVADIDDVILNTLGGFLGYGLRCAAERVGWRGAFEDHQTLAD